jgi:hypothetical protein
MVTLDLRDFPIVELFVNWLLIAYLLDGFLALAGLTLSLRCFSLLQRVSILKHDLFDGLLAFAKMLAFL